MLCFQELTIDHLLLVVVVDDNVEAGFAQTTIFLGVEDDVCCATITVGSGFLSSQSSYACVKVLFGTKIISHAS